MPNYQYENLSTGETFERMESWDDSQKFLAENPNVRRVIGAPKIISGTNMRSKIPDWHKDNLKRMKV